MCIIEREEFHRLKKKYGYKGDKIPSPVPMALVYFGIYGLGSVHCIGVYSVRDLRNLFKECSGDYIDVYYPEDYTQGMSCTCYQYIKGKWYGVRTLVGGAPEYTTLREYWKENIWLDQNPI